MCVSAGVGIPIHCCVWAGDRAALAQKYNVLDNACNPCCSFMCCSVCLLTQELNHIAANVGRQGPTSIVISQQQPVQQVMAAPYAQQPMAPYGQPVPQNFAQPPPAYAPQPQNLYPPQPQGFAPQQPQPQYPPPPQNFYPPQQMQG
jgi:hypothetical protein